MVVSLFDKFINASLSGDTDAVVSLHDKDAKILIDGFPPVIGLDGRPIPIYLHDFYIIALYWHWKPLVIAQNRC